MNAVDFQHVTFRYEHASRDALHDLTLAIPEGAFVGLTGSGGTGKSTLLYAIAGAVPHYLRGDFYGACRVFGHDTVDTPPVELARTVGLVMQDTESQFVAVEVEDELRFGLDNFGVPAEEYEPRLYFALEACGIVPLRNRILRELSGGQKRKVAIASILALRPKLLLLDEPTGELDPPSKRQVFETLKALNGQGYTIVVAEKNTKLLTEYCEKIIRLEDGHCAQEN
ncbi:MAG: energy-coupling factor ABC transporter ATP-binding protein [Oscillospiraceae bacterium]|jgi:energy-coupling factor transporter ATP-binding protein EcfA2|nr:energy-coupling factor ABC transporter ATP-binding protein [Oscillospiraceae bacterium]